MLKDQLLLTGSREHDLGTIDYLRDTVSSIKKMTDPNSGFPCDIMEIDTNYRTERTSLTNIGLALVTTSILKELELMAPTLSDHQMHQILNTLKYAMTTDAFRNGLFTNWFTTEGLRFQKFPYEASCVDHAWLLTGLKVAEQVFPGWKGLVHEILSDIEFQRFYDPQTTLLYGTINFENGKPSPSQWRYGARRSESRQAAYVGIDQFGLPPDVFYAMSNDQQSCNGTAFEDLMPTLFVDEPREFHKEYLQKMISDGQNNRGFWGKSSCMTEDGYHECSVTELAFNPYVHTTTIITPHASLLALPFAHDAVLQNLAQLRNNFPTIYQKEYGFMDSVDVETQVVCRQQLFLDQAMSLCALYNAHKPPKRLSSFLQSTNETTQRLFAGMSTMASEPALAMAA